MGHDSASVSHGTWAERAFAPGSEIRDDADGALYRVGRFLGRGGMGEVHEVVRVDSGVRYALKCLLLQHARNAKTIERTRREALTLRELRHPNVVPVHATGVLDDGLIWMVMDLLEGHTLAAVKHRMGKLPLPWALAVGRSVASGLAAVHAFAVHRDVKPDNVHLGNDATVRVLDLGAGKFHSSLMMTTADRTLGTVPYMSPEQLTIDAPVDGRSDVFSLGTLLVELISGIHPFAPDGFDNENVFTLVRRIVTSPVSLAALAPWVPAFVAATIDKALARAASERYESATAFAAALDADLDRLERAVGRREPLQTLVRHLNRAPSPTGLEAPSAEPGLAARAPIGAPERAAPAAPPASRPGPAAQTVDDEADTNMMVRRS
jgi:serine/threonine-protein kinase